MNIFNTVNLPRPKRSKFNLTHERTFSCEMGRLIPNFCEEVIPSDKWSVSTAFKLELAPLIAPLMHNIDVYQYYFYVPNYILSSAWNSWISQGEPADSPNIPAPPRFTLASLDNTIPTAELLSQLAGPGSLLDYLGFSNEYARLNETFPSGTTLSGLKSYSLLPLQAYHAIWLNFFRNQNFTPLPNSWGTFPRYNELYDTVSNYNLADWKSWNYYYRHGVTAPLQAYVYFGKDEDTSQGVDNLVMRSWPRKANFMHDYFTASLPFTQRGPVVSIPIAENATITGSGRVMAGQPIQIESAVLGGSASTDFVKFRHKRLTSGGNALLSNDDYLGTNPGSDMTVVGDTDNPVSGISSNGLSGSLRTNLSVDPNTLEVDLSDATGLSIIDLRRLSKLQQWLEKNAIGGNTPGENLFNHFGVKPSDQSLDKPVFLGGGRVPVAISNILQTSQSTEQSAQATPSGYARSQGFAGFKNRFFREHGWIIGICYVMPRSKYMQGTRRYWDRSSRFDYFWMEFERIGEQPVYNYEIFDDGTTGVNNEEFGYNPRYSDYKYIPSSVHGDFKTSLAFWHAARLFSSRPKLNASFLHLGTDIEDRIFAVSSERSSQNCWFWCRHQVRVKRPMLKNPTSILG